MIRTFKKTVALLLLSIFFVSAFQLSAKTQIGIQTVYAGDASVIYASMWSQTTSSQNAARNTSDMINYLFTQHMGPYNDIIESTGSGVTQSNVLSYMDSLEDDYDYVAFFHYGHYSNTFQWNYYWNYDEFFQWWYWQPSQQIMHYTYRDYNGGYVSDSDIYSYTNENKHYFVFLWTCVNAEIDGYLDASNDTYIGTGAVGMPFAFTKNSSLSSNGYTNPDGGSYTFIGFNGTSKGLDETCSGTQHTYSDFATDFYAAALSSNSNSINAALDIASAQIWGAGTKFNATEVYSYYGPNMDNPPVYNVPSGMHVWGNGNLVLPH